MSFLKTDPFDYFNPSREPILRSNLTGKKVSVSPKGDTTLKGNLTGAPINPLSPSRADVNQERIKQPQPDRRNLKNPFSSEEDILDEIRKELARRDALYWRFGLNTATPPYQRGMSNIEARYPQQDYVRGIRLNTDVVPAPTYTLANRYGLLFY